MTGTVKCSVQAMGNDWNVLRLCSERAFEVLTNTGDIVEWWKEHFEELPNLQDVPSHQQDLLDRGGPAAVPFTSCVTVVRAMPTYLTEG